MVLVSVVLVLDIGTRINTVNSIRTRVCAIRRTANMSNNNHVYSMCTSRMTCMCTGMCGIIIISV